MTTIKTHLVTTLNTINDSEKAFNRPTNSVQLLAVSKSWSSSLLREAAIAGQACFGENYLQEALVKIRELADLNLEWHFIGPIQSNKTKDIAQHFDWVQSIDRIKIAQRLSNQRSTAQPNLNICIQVNVDNESSKAGVTNDTVLDFAKQLETLERLTLRGLMIIPTKTDDFEQQRAAFKKAHHLFNQLVDYFPTVDTLSMGMSGDMTAAIAEGSTMVRIGTALFGQRTPSTPPGKVN